MSAESADAAVDDAGAHTGEPTPPPTDLQAYLDQQEREVLTRVLRETHFNRTLAAAKLGLNLRQIRYRIQRLQIPMPNGTADHDE